MLATAVYSGPIPPNAEGKKAKDANASNGLAVVVIRALAEEQWVKEEWLAEKLNLGAKQVRKVLHYLESEGVLRRWQTTERRDDRAPITGRTGDETGAARTYPYCCIDFPRMLDCIRLRLHWMRQSLTSKASEHDHLTAYRCTSCASEWTELELVGRLQDSTGRFACPHCEFVCEPLSDELSVADAESEAAKERRKEKIADLRARADEQLKPLEDMVHRALNGPVLDFGTLQEWKEARRAARRQGAEGLQETLQEHVNRGSSHGLQNGYGGGSGTGARSGPGGAKGSGSNGNKRAATDDGPEIDVLQHTRFEVDLNADDEERPSKAHQSATGGNSKASSLPSWFSTPLGGNDTQPDNEQRFDIKPHTEQMKGNREENGKNNHVDTAQEAYWHAFMEQLHKEMNKKNVQQKEAEPSQTASDVERLKKSDETDVSESAAQQRHAQTSNALTAALEEGEDEEWEDV